MIRPEPVQNSGLGIRRDCPRQPITHRPRPSPASDPAQRATAHRQVGSSAGLVSPGVLDERAAGAARHQTDSQPSHAIAPAPPRNTSDDPSKAVQNPSEVCQGYETARASTLTASSTGQTSDGPPQGPLRSALPVLRQSVVKVAPSTTSNVRRRRPPALPARPGV